MPWVCVFYNNEDNLHYEASDDEDSTSSFSFHPYLNSARVLSHMSVNNEQVLTQVSTSGKMLRFDCSSLPEMWIEISRDENGIPVTVKGRLEKNLFLSPDVPAKFKITKIEDRVYILLMK